MKTYKKKKTQNPWNRTHRNNQKTKKQNNIKINSHQACFKKKHNPNSGHNTASLYATCGANNSREKS